MMAPPAPPRLSRAATFVAAATVGSRLLGLVREIVVAALFGATDAKAAYVIGYYLPFFIQRLFIGGTLSIVLIPTLADVQARRDPEELRRVSAYLFTAVLGIGVGMVLFGILAAPLLVPLAAPGFTANPAQFDLTVYLTRINFLSMFFLALSVFATAYLQALQRFGPPAVAPLLFNVTTIALTLWLGPRLGITGLAIAWVAGTAAQFLTQAPALRTSGFRARLAVDWSHPAIQTVRRLAVPAMLGLAVVEINAYVGRFLASLLPVSPGVNAVAALDYAYEIVQAPIGILAISVATVLFPSMSQAAASGDRVALRQSTSLGLRAMLFLVLPVSAVLMAFATPAVRVVFERGEFGPPATATVGACLTAYAAGLVPMAAYYVVTRAFYALQMMRTPVAVGARMVVVNAVLAYLLMQRLGVAGIALATAIVAFINVGVLLVILGRALGALEGGRMMRTAARTAVATAAAVAVGWWVTHLGAVASLDGTLGRVVTLALGLGVAAGVYLAACLILRVEELGLLRDLVRRRPAGRVGTIP
ncbi:MAG: murein biosynthesis integral membrane protein MurJ [Armatimonadetes bacterium]|nr:murein biosynthesis integral membrane protein MurJ [Armatimonadota bacterium]